MMHLMSIDLISWETNWRSMFSLSHNCQCKSVCSIVFRRALLVSGCVLK